MQIKSASYLTKISARRLAPTSVGMTTLRVTDGKQVKWDYGAFDLMWPGRAATRGQPFHPNLRLHWAEKVLGMLDQHLHPHRVPPAAG